MKTSNTIRTLFVALFSVVALVHHSYAQDKIEGAFGQTLGATFDTSTAIGQGSLTDGTPMYRFSPKSPFRSLDRYYVLITPKTKKIYSIWGIGNVENRESGVKEQAVIITLLEKKYGDKKNEGLMDSLEDIKRVDQGNRSVLVNIDGFMDVTIDVRYYDYDLAKLAEKERIQLEAEKVDDSGL